MTVFVGYLFWICFCLLVFLVVWFVCVVAVIGFLCYGLWSGCLFCDCFVACFESWLVADVCIC